MCRAVVSIAMESPFTVRRARLFSHLGATGGVPRGSPSFRSKRFRSASVSGVARYSTRFTHGGRVDDDAEALPTVPVRLQIKGALEGPPLAARKGGEPARSRFDLSHPTALRWVRRVHRGYDRPELRENGGVRH